MRHVRNGFPAAIERTLSAQGASSAGRIHTCSELAVGDHVEARFNGTTSYRGQVTEVADHLDIFWMEDRTGGGRKLVDFRNFYVYRQQDLR